MPMLVFFPWLRIEQDYRFNDTYALRCYEIGKADAFGTTSYIDRILASYVDTNGKPLRKFTLLQLCDKELTADLNEQQITELFTFREYLAFAALAEVEFFKSDGHYTNYSAFSMVLQSFNTEAENLALTARRKDGSSTRVDNIANIQFHQPHYVPETTPYINQALLNGLLKYESKKNSLSHAIWLFNQSWSDDNSIREETEIIFLCSAIEELMRKEINYSGFHEDKFSESLLKLLKHLIDEIPKTTSWLRTAGLIERELKKRAEKESKPDSIIKKNDVREIWGIDFYRTRNKSAHGQYKHEDFRCWNVHEHQLLASFIFPLLIKHLLKESGLYIPSAHQYRNLSQNNFIPLTDSSISDEARIEALPVLLQEERCLNQRTGANRYCNQSVWTDALKKADGIVFRKFLEKTITDNL